MTSIGLKDFDSPADGGRAAGDRGRLSARDAERRSKRSTHYGVLFTSRKQLPRSKKTIGLYVRVLDDFLSRHSAEDAMLNSYGWLPDRPL